MWYSLGRLEKGGKDKKFFLLFFFFFCEATKMHTQGSLCLQIFRATQLKRTQILVKHPGQLERDYIGTHYSDPPIMGYLDVILMSSVWIYYRDGGL